MKAAVLELPGARLITRETLWVNGDNAAWNEAAIASVQDSKWTELGRENPPAARGCKVRGSQQSCLSWQQLGSGPS